MTIAHRLQAIETDIAEAARSAHRDRSDILLLGVSKKQPFERLADAYRGGLRDFGENYVQGLQAHQEQMTVFLADAPQSEAPRWHFIGHLQSNKVKKLGLPHLIHSVDSIKLAKHLGKQALEKNAEQAILVHVNISEEPSKSGIAPAELESLLTSLAELSGIRVNGLMCIPSPTEPAQAAFSRMRELRDRAQINSPFDLRELSMGMSSSYKEAIAEGATIIRVGTALFGERPRP